MRLLSGSVLFVLAFALGACSAKPGATAAASAGKRVFDANCAVCHGAGGQGGGIGPSLRNEKTRKDFVQTQAWIKDPQPPMPKLYPGKISEKDVRDVAAYVQTL